MLAVFCVVVVCDTYSDGGLMGVVFECVVVSVFMCVVVDVFVTIVCDVIAISLSFVPFLPASPASHSFLSSTFS